jgi:hypothetical protein
MKWLHQIVFHNTLVFWILAWRYQRAARRWYQTPCAENREAAFRAQDRMYHCNRRRAHREVMGER